jgi:hypothetical protein
MNLCTKCENSIFLKTGEDSDTMTTQCSRCGHIQLWVNIAVVHTGPSPVKPMEHWAPAERVDGGTIKVTGVPCDPPGGRLDIPFQESFDDDMAREAFQTAINHADLKPLLRELSIPSEFPIILPPDSEGPPKRSAKEFVKDAIKNGRWEFPRTNQDNSKENT